MTESKIGKAILSYPIDHGEIFNIVAMDYEHSTWEHQKSIVPAKRGELDRLYKGWGKATQGLVEVQTARLRLHVCQVR